jgi:hypothetical protein
MQSFSNLGIGAFILGVAALLWEFRLPTAEPASSPSHRFSAVRALEHVEVLARAPRPTGSLRHAEARSYLVSALDALGAEVDDAPVSALGAFYGMPFDTGRVRNVVGRFRGSSSTGTVVLVAHYDTMAASPGASDNASGVAAILESVRAAMVGGPPRNDIVVLFTDAEEGGLLGALSFAQQNTLGERRVFVNLDARGTGGRPVVVGLTEPNQAWLDRIDDAGVISSASSLFTDATRRVHRGTDYGALAARGFSGVNLAFADDLARYHAGSDRIEHLDPRTLQAEGDLALALLRTLAGTDLGDENAAVTHVFYSPGGLFGVRYPRAAAQVLAVLAIVAAAVGVTLARRRGQVRWRELARTTAWTFGVALLSGAMAFAAWRLLLLDPVLDATGPSGPYDPTWSRLAIAAFGVAGALLARATRGTAHFDVASLVPLSAFAFATCLVAPGASHVFVVPLLLLAGSTLATSKYPRVEAALTVFASGALGYFGAQIAYLLLLVAPTSISAAAATVVGLYASAVPTTFRRKSPAVVATLVGVGCWGGQFASATFDERRPQPSCLAYGFDATSGMALWMTDERVPSTFSQPFIPARAKRSNEPAFFIDPATLVRTGPAPSSFELAPPVVELIAAVPSGDVVRVRLRARSPRGAPWLFVMLEPGAAVLAASVQGMNVPESVAHGPLAADERWGFRHVGLDERGIEIELTVPRASRSLSLRLVDQSFELPAGVPPRAADSTACRSWITDSTFVSATHRLALDVSE